MDTVTQDCGTLVPTLLLPGCSGAFPSPQSVDCASHASPKLLFLLPRFGKNKMQCCQAEKLFSFFASDVHGRLRSGNEVPGASVP